MNVTVINIKEIFKYLFLIILSLFIFVNLLNINNTRKKEINNLQSNLYISLENIEEKNLIRNIDTIIPLVKTSFKNDESNDEKQQMELRVLSKELNIINNIKLAKNKKNNENNREDQSSVYNEIANDPQEEIIELAQTGVTTQVIDENNITPSYTNNYESIKIKNQTDYDLSEIIKNASYEFKNTKKIAIYHTHTTESYSQSEKYKYAMTGDFRTTDLNYTVARVGDELDKQLTQYGYQIVHDKTYHDYPSYNGSYGRSLTTLQNILKENPDVEVAIDLHRDAVGSNGTYGPRVKIGDEYCAQLMFVIGTDGSGLLHPKWKQNLQYAMKVQQKANELYPGLFRPINLRTSRFNQHLTTATTIIEVGATGNTLDECISSMKYLAKVLSQVVM